MERHGRQVRLAEVGSAGQLRIGAATIDVELRGFAADVALRYLAGAGVGCVRIRSHALAGVVTSIDPAVRVEVEEDSGGSGMAGEVPLAPLDLRDPVARDVALGARTALRALRALLEGAP